MNASWPFEPRPDPEPPGWPDRPSYPNPPERAAPQRTGPVMVPIVDLPGATSRSRRVMLSGSVDADTATRTAAELMELDGRSGDDVELIVNSDGGRLMDVVGLLDVVAVMRARVNTMCVGRALGTAAVVLACGTGSRRAGPHATISLRCHQPERLEGSSEAVRCQLEELEHVRTIVIDQLVRATGKPASELADQLEHGPLLDRRDAAEIGIVDSLEDR